MARRLVRRLRSGRYKLALTDDERDVLRALPGQLIELLADGTDPSLRRLFPPAYHEAEHAGQEAEYQRLMHDDLTRRHAEALEVITATVDAGEVDTEQLHGWLRGLNELRLVIGTRLDVSEETFDRELDPADHDAPALALYAYLGWLQEHVVEALSG
ncbi:MAG TPA: DUF2017 family protein [Acidimicrobiales bacterium]|nr:DUF2017 family protein [Acidimicrobiales bacterium]